MLQAEHLDEGTLHALLDGELDSDQLADAEQHLAECAECAAQMERARTMLEESDELVNRLEPAPFVVLPEPSAMGGRVGEPMVLMPPEPETPRPGTMFTPRRRLRASKPLALAAGVILAVSAGWALTRGGGAAPEVQLARGDGPAQRVVSEAENPRGESVDGAETALLDSAPATASAPAAAPDAAEASDEAAPPAAQQNAPADDQAARDQAARDQAARDQAARDQAARDAAAREAAAEREREQEQEAARQLAARRAAQQRAAEPESGAAAGAAAPVVAAAPPPAAASDPASALERRAGVYLRVGLDEARRMLGGPVHAIEGMRPQFVGLAASDGLAGADPARPVVRAVYLDPAQRLIMLDQQRRPGGEEGESGGRILLQRGDVRLWLHGAVPVAELRQIAQRVR